MIGAVVVGIAALGVAVGPDGDGHHSGAVGLGSRILVRPYQLPSSPGIRFSATSVSWHLGLRHGYQLQVAEPQWRAFACLQLGQSIRSG